MESFLNLNFVAIIKCAICIAIIIGVVMAPAWLARQNGKAKYDMMLIRMASWVFGWTGFGWLWALFWGARK